jgi:hypothetical protein
MKSVDSFWGALTTTGISGLQTTIRFLRTVIDVQLQPSRGVKYLTWNRGGLSFWVIRLGMRDT